jgi:hypothetical protein
MPERAPVEAVLLCIGPENSVTVLVPDEDEDTPETIFLGTTATKEDRDECLRLAKEYEEFPDIPLVIVAEKGEHWDKWRTEVNGVPVMISVPVDDTWRKLLFGSRYPRSRERAKKKAQAYLVHALGLMPHGEDVAEVVCLGAWASRAEQIYNLVKKLKEAA